MSMLILSGSNNPQYSTSKNHAAYALRHGYDYIFDRGPYQRLPNPYFHKVAAISHHLPNYDWIFWLDDDAAFTQLGISIESLVPEINNNPTAIFCRSPINRGMWTYISSGNFLIRNCEDSFALLNAVLSADLGSIEVWWDSEKFGLFTHGDQDALVYNIATGNFGDIFRLEYERFNTRPFHFHRSSEDNFLVHFTSSPGATKTEQMKQFARKFKLNKFLLHPNPVLRRLMRWFNY